ncbi:hypothetical protein D3C73_925010 [compost metagenome]
MGHDPGGDRAGLGDRRTAAPAAAQALRPALVACAGPGAGLRADQPVRAGAGTEEAGALWPHQPGRSARYLRSAGVGDWRDQHPCQLRGRQPEGAGAGARGRSQAAPRRHRRRRRLAGTLVPGPGAAADPLRVRTGCVVEDVAAGTAQDPALGSGRPVAGRRQRAGALPEVPGPGPGAAAVALPLRARGRG